METCVCGGKSNNGKNDRHGMCGGAYGISILRWRNLMICVWHNKLVFLDMGMVVKKTSMAGDKTVVVFCSDMVMEWTGEPNIYLSINDIFLTSNRRCVLGQLVCIWKRLWGMGPLSFWEWVGMTGDKNEWFLPSLTNCLYVALNI